MVADVGTWISIPNVIGAIISALCLSVIYAFIRFLKSRHPNPITEETNERLTALLDAIERENKAAVAERDKLRADNAALQAKLDEAEANYTAGLADYDRRYSETQIALAQMAIRNTQLATRLKQLEDAYQADTGKTLPPVPVAHP